MNLKDFAIIAAILFSGYVGLLFLNRSGESSNGSGAQPAGGSPAGGGQSFGGKQPVSTSTNGSTTKPATNTRTRGTSSAGRDTGPIINPLPEPSTPVLAIDDPVGTGGGDRMQTQPRSTDVIRNR